MPAGLRGGGETSWRLTGGERGVQPELQAGDVIEHQVEECGCLAGVERCRAGS